MSVIIRLQNLPWSANALDIRNFFRGLSIPEGGVHIVGGELGDAFIAFSTDEDARQGMMLDGGKIKEIQVRLLLSSRSEMHKVIEAARQSVPIMTLTAPAPAPAPPAPLPPVSQPAVPAIPAVPTPPVISPFSTALGNNSLSNSLSSFGIPGIGNPQEIPQPAVIEPPAPLLSPPVITTEDTERDEDKFDKKKDKDRKRGSRSRTRSRSRSRDRDRKDRKRDRRDRSRSRERRRRDRSRSRDRRDRKRDRKERSRSRDRSPSRRSRDRRAIDRKSPQGSQDRERREIKPFEEPEAPNAPSLLSQLNPQQIQQMANNALMQQNQVNQIEPNRFSDPAIADTYNKLQELGKKRNPNAFQGEPPNGSGGGGGRFNGGRQDNNIRGPNFRRDARGGRFDNPQQRECCVAIRNAPNHTSYGDVRRFFPFMIDKHGIKMINDNMGRRTGNIFVRFCEPRSRQLALQRKNNELKGAQVIVEPLDDDTYDVAIDSFLPYREENDEEEPTLVIADAQEQNQNQMPFTVLKMTELPNFVKEHDIIKQFSDFSLLSIMLNDCRLTRSKVAFVQFVNPNDARLALERKERIIFGRRHPTIVPVSDEDYEKEKNQTEKPEPRIPKDPRPEEPPAPQREPVAPRDPRQRRFENAVPPGGPQQQQPQFFPAAPFMQGQQFGAPFAATPQFGGYPGPGAVDPRTAAANWASRPGFPNQMPGPGVGSMHKPINIEDEPLDCVLMKGLPRDATDRTIVKFLSDTGAVPARIHLMLDGNGLPSGDCFCEFRATEEARQAGTKHGHDLDGCRVTVDLVSRSVVEEALEGPKQPEMRDSLLGSVPLGNGMPLGNGPPQQYFDGPMRGGFQPRGGSNYRGRGSFDRGFDRGFRGGFDSSRGGYDSSRGGFDSSRGGFDSSRGGFDSSSRGGFDTGRGGGFRGRGGFNDRGRGFDRGRGRGFGRGGGRFENGRDREDDQDPALEDFGAPGCVVSMENVPFRANVEEILNFFSEFDLTQDDIIRRYNEKGQPTGDARVAFRTPFDAQRAVKTRHMDTIHDRRIALTIL